jgi:hypothetical protein
MPSWWFPSYTNCSDPKDYYGIPVWALALIGGTGVAALIAAAVAGAWIPSVAAFLATVCLAGITFCTWWLNVRLICLGGDRGAGGVIYSVDPPNPSLDAFDFGAYDTDYSFDLLLWPLPPEVTLPSSFVGNDSPSQFNPQEWDPVSVGDLWSDSTFWDQTIGNTLVDAFGQPVQLVKDQVNLILPQQSMVSLNLPFTGEPSSDTGNIGGVQSPGGSDQQFLLHCEIEGPGMYELRTLLWVLFGVFVLAAALSAIPVIGPILSLILSILAFLAFLFGGPAIQQDDASPPSGGGWGGSFNPYSGGNPNAPVDLAYVYGRWVYDSLHTGWNELHPLHFMIKIGTTTAGSLGVGKWPTDLGDLIARYDLEYGVINAPSTVATQAEPQNQWTLHPLLDGCLAGTGYPDPPPPVIQ